MTTNDTYKGIIHGSTVELLRSPNIPDGIEVEVMIKRSELTNEQRQQQLKDLFGSCKDDADDLNDFMKWNDAQRKRNRPGAES